MTFVVSPDHSVHIKACRDAAPDAIPYVTAAKTPEELHANLDRPDTKDRRQAPGLVVACDVCL